MSVARIVRRTALLTRPALGASTTQVRHASSSSSHDHDHGHQQEEYPPEGFVTPFWRNVVLAGAATAAFFKFAPEPSDDVYLTRWIAMYKTSRDQWLARNAYHTVMAMDYAENSLLLNDAKRPAKYRLNYPQALDRGSPFKQVPGTHVDMDGVQEKL